MSNGSTSARLEPVANALPSFWNAEPQPLDNLRTTEDLPATADVVIIGGGYAGVTTAYHLLNHAAAPESVVLLEARQICSGATGRNGGHIKPEMYYGLAKFAKTYGMEAAAELGAFEAAHVYAVKELVEKEDIDCDFHITRAVDVFLDAAHAAKTEAAYRWLVAAGVVNMRDVAFVSKKDAERISGFKGAQCAFNFTAAHVWPLKLVHGILQRTIDKHAGKINVQANTPVASVSAAADEQGLWTVRTARGDVRARRVVYASNAYTGQILPEYAGRIVPVRGLCSRITTPRGAAAPLLVNSMAVRFDERNYDYLIPRPDGSVVVGGGGQRFWHDRASWFGNHRDDQLIELGRDYFDGYMQRHFHGWEDSGATTDRVWTGVMGYSADWMPHVGHVPNKPGQFIIAGFTGHGMPQILLSSKGLADMILADAPFADTGIPKLFETSEKRMLSKESPLEAFYGTFWTGQNGVKNSQH